ncbi:MAG: hypothetical protein MI747_00535 [Desulfobacterales bacterium]|nr:hypothetical protein [Desulfobacterales bacterium]
MEDKAQRIQIIDATIREGMQYRGLVFTLEQRLALMEYQNQLQVDVCQAGYPSAHPLEAEMVTRLAEHARSQGYGLRTAALGRAAMADAQILVETGVDDIHFHLHLPPDTPAGELGQILAQFEKVMAFVRRERPKAQVVVAVLDMGKTRPELLNPAVKHLCCDLGCDLVSLPDTSGIMAPHQVARVMGEALKQVGDKGLSIHCHNDMGMASANSLTGVRAGARALEASALGIGERNGIADLFTTVRLLDLPPDRMPRLQIQNQDTFQAYYQTLSDMAQAQTGQPLIRYDTPVFGKAVTVHVAGTHAGMGFGISGEETFYLNLLCGRRMVATVLEQWGIPYDPNRLKEITTAVKATSLRRGSRLNREDLQALAPYFY